MKNNVSSMARWWSIVDVGTCRLLNCTNLLMTRKCYNRNDIETCSSRVASRSSLWFMINRLEVCSYIDNRPSASHRGYIVLHSSGDYDARFRRYLSLVLKSLWENVCRRLRCYYGKNARHMIQLHTKYVPDTHVLPRHSFHDVQTL